MELDGCRPEAGRSQSVLVSATHQHDAKPFVSGVRDKGANEELTFLRSEITSLRAAEVKSLFLRQDLQDQLLKLRKDLDDSRQAVLELEWRHKRQDEAQEEFHAREAMKRQQELQAALQEVQEIKQMREKQEYPEDDAVAMNAELDTLRQRDSQLEENAIAMSAEIDMLRQRGSQLEGANCYREVALREQDSSRQGELVLLRTQLEEANALAEQGELLQDEVIGMSAQLDAARKKEARLQEQLWRAMSEIEGLRGMKAREHHLEDEVNALSQREKEQGEELARVRLELEQAQRAKEDLKQQLNLDGAAETVAGLHKEMQAMTIQLNTLSGRDAQQREELGRAYAELDEMRAQVQRQQQQPLVLPTRTDSDEVCCQRMLTQSETTTTCSSDCAKDAEEGSMAATLEALHGCEKQRQELHSQAAGMAIELAALRAREVEREEKMQRMLCEMHGARRASEDAEAKLANAETARLKMREDLLSRLAAIRQEQGNAHGLTGLGVHNGEFPQIQLDRPAMRLPEGALSPSMRSELEETLQFKDHLLLDLKEAARRQEDLQGELLRARTHLSVEAVEKSRAMAVMQGELAALRSELATAHAVQDLQQGFPVEQSESNEAVQSDQSLGQRMYEELSALEVNLQEAERVRRNSAPRS